MNKKGDSTWISAVLYFGIGIIIISILLASGTPVINRIRDKNIISQTKVIMSNLDYNIREAAKGGPGSQRVVDLDLSKGEFNIDVLNDLVYWKFDSKVLLGDVCTAVPSDIATNVGSFLNQADPNCPVIAEGTLKQIITKSSTSNPYTIYIILDYNDRTGTTPIPTVNLLKQEKMISTITGLTKLTIKNPGATTTDATFDEDSKTWTPHTDPKYVSVEFIQA